LSLFEWYLARASGMTAFALLTITVELECVGSAALVAGLLTYRAGGSQPKAATLPTFGPSAPAG
jgi:hypothetical protein